MVQDKKIKIFVDGHSFDTEFQGTQTFIRGLYNTLLKNYPDLDIYIGAYNTERIKKGFPGIESSKILRYKKRKPAILRFLIDIPDIIQKNQFDFAHFQYIAPAATPNCKYIVTIHDILFNDFSKEFSWQYRQNRNFLFSRSIRKADIKTTVSNYSRERICYYYEILPEQLHVIPNGINSPSGNPVLKQNASQVVKEKYGIENFILCVSRIEPRKNHLLLLNKFLELELYKQNISLVFIGKRSLKVREFEKKIWSLTDEQKKFFHWFEQVEQEELEYFYQACRLFAYPSKAEGFGVPPLEAAVCGAPVLCSNATAMKDYAFFEPFTFDPENKMEFEEKLKAMIDSPPSASELDKISEEVIKRYSCEKSAAIFYKLLKSNKTL